MTQSCQALATKTELEQVKQRVQKLESLINQKLDVSEKPQIVQAASIAGAAIAFSQLNPKILELAGKLSGILGTIASILLQLTLFGVIQGQIAQLFNQVGQLFGITSAQQKEINGLQTQTEEAIAKAFTAQREAEMATNKANQAYTESIRATGLASVAQGEAQSARSSALQAEREAKSASQEAKEAFEKAIAAKVQADEAIREASTAYEEARKAIVLGEMNAQSLSALRTIVTSLENKVGEAIKKAQAAESLASIAQRKADYALAEAQKKITGAEADKKDQGVYTRIKSYVDGKLLSNRLGASGGGSNASLEGQVSSLNNKVGALENTANTKNKEVENELTKLGGLINSQTRTNSQTNADTQNKINSLSNTVANVQSQVNSKINVNDQQYTDVNNKLTNLDKTLQTAIAPALLFLKFQTSQGQIANAAATGFCSTTQAGGCASNNITTPIKNAINNPSWLAGLNAALAGAGSVGNAAIITKLNQMQTFAETAWKSLHLDKALQVANTVLLVHNAMMLSRNLGQSLGDVTSQVLNAFGIKDEKGQALDINQIIGSKINAAITAVIGQEAYTDIQSTFNKANRILTAAQGVVWAIRGMKDAATEVGEILGSWIAKIGNNMMSQGLFEDRTFNWMNENPQFRQHYSKFVDRIDNLDDATSQISSIVSNTTEFTEELNNAVTNTTTLIQLMDEFDAPKETAETTAKTASASPEITNSDLNKSEQEN